MRGVGKAVDDDNPIVPIQKPRGYGGVGILWNNSLDSQITVLPDGGNRVQCVELKTKHKPLLLISVYLPCRGKSTTSDEFKDCVDQLHEIITKHEHSHYIVLGGDFNEDLHKEEQSTRKTYLQDMISDNGFTFTALGATFIHPNGRDCSEIDYILHKEDRQFKIVNISKCDNLPSNVSDHYPIRCTIDVDIQKVQHNEEDKNTLPSKVPWDKVDKELYLTLVSEDIQNLDISLETPHELDSTLQKVNNLLVVAANSCYTKKKVGNRKPKLKVWTEDIREALKNSKKAHYQYKIACSNGTLDNSHIDERKSAKRQLRTEIRKEQARKQADLKDTILEAKTRDTKLFHRLIREQRGAVSDTTTEIIVNQESYRGNDAITIWKEHFEQLASASSDSSFDVQYTKQVEDDFYVIMDICKDGQESSKVIYTTTVDEITSAVKQLNTNKSPDAYGVTTEHILYGGNVLLTLLAEIFNAILYMECIPDILKLGTITPVFKKKGNKNDCKNYRGITVLPVIGKLLEIILRTRLRDILDSSQNPLQRGFTAKSSPLNCALIIEEFIRESQDLKNETFVALLDAKAAFDVVSHHSLLRKLYNYGVDGSLWNLVCDFHNNAVSAVKWNGKLSDTFTVTQGVRQGGILSADLYKLYINDLLNRMQDSQIGGKVGNIPCSAPTCADDMTNLSNTSGDLQTLCNIAHDYSTMEKYKLQPTKSVVLPVNTKKSKLKESSYSWKIGESDMPIVDRATHVGLVRASKPTADAAIEENIRKGRRTLYSLMSSGLHGENGLDVETSVHLLKVYVIPVLLYGLEIYLPSEVTLRPMELMFKKTLKHILSLPITVADPVPYILTGLIPLEGAIHIRALTMFGNICSLPDTSIEKQLANRQLSIKSFDSHSWFIKLRELQIKYDLPDIQNLLSSPMKKDQWKIIVTRAVYEYWKQRLISSASLYTSLKYLSYERFTPGCIHPLVNLCIGAAREVPRLAVQVKLATGTYILQVNRVAFNQQDVDPTCVLCKSGNEDLEHFLLLCSALDNVRAEYLDDIKRSVENYLNCEYDSLTNVEKMQVFLDFYRLSPKAIKRKVARSRKDDVILAKDLAYHTRRYCYALHIARYYAISKLPTRKRHGL